MRNYPPRGHVLYVAGKERETESLVAQVRRGFWIRLSFSEPICGPVRLGHSSNFGLGSS
jgi:hypothetical protein